jgi:hypothetical protein
VLVTKSDLEEKRGRMSELELQVNELTLQNEYQLRLKDLNLNEKIKVGRCRLTPGCPLVDPRLSPG